MNNLRLLHWPAWQFDEPNWNLVAANRVVAVLMPNSDLLFPHYKWISVIVCDRCNDDGLEDHGWDAVDFDTLECAQETIEHWWRHARRGQAYRP